MIALLIAQASVVAMQLKTLDVCFIADCRMALTMRHPSNIMYYVDLLPLSWELAEMY